MGDASKSRHARAICGAQRRDKRYNAADLPEMRTMAQSRFVTPDAPRGNLMPFFQPAPQKPLWAIATLDTGASASILSYQTTQAMHLEWANREGTGSVAIGGAGPTTEYADVSDGLGLYFTGLQN